MAQVIVISNQKGGVGKTTTAINLSSALAVAERRVLLIDLDPQANTTSGFGFTPDKQEKTIYKVLLEDLSLREAILETELKYLDLVASNQDLIGAERELVSALGREVRLKEAVESVSENYDFIIIDCPPALGLLTVNALTAADSVLIPLQCEYYALEGLSQLTKTIALIKKRLNPSIQIEGILLTMYDKRNNLSFQVEEEVKKHFPDKVFEVSIPRNVRVSEAPSHGKSVILYDIQSPGAQAYLNLGKILLTRYGKIQKNTQSLRAKKALTTPFDKRDLKASLRPPKESINEEYKQL